jgi:CO/xanthine dehydrogenase FAD-binding subunit
LKPADFQYHRPRQTDEALSLLNELGEDGKILAGGQSLMPLMNFRLAQPRHLIDINFIEGLDYIRNENGRVKIGCLTRQSRLLNDPIIAQSCPLLAVSCTFVGYNQTRNRGTVCGSLAHADPAGEFPAVWLALDGLVSVGNLTSRREIAAKDLFVSYYTTALASNELILETSIPEVPQNAGWSFMEFARRFGDFAIVAVAVQLVADGDKISDARIALTGVGDKPWREREVEEMLIGEDSSVKLFRDVGAEVSKRISPGSDLHASAGYRRSLSEVLTRRALTDAWGKARKAQLQASSPLTGEK